jgi:hypothetical protein
VPTAFRWFTSTCFSLALITVNCLRHRGVDMQIFLLAVNWERGDRSQPQQQYVNDFLELSGWPWCVWKITCPWAPCQPDRWSGLPEA